MVSWARCIQEALGSLERKDIAVEQCPTLSTKMVLTREGVGSPEGGQRSLPGGGRLQGVFVRHGGAGRGQNLVSVPAQVFR